MYFYSIPFEGFFLEKPRMDLFSYSWGHNRISSILILVLPLILFINPVFYHQKFNLFLKYYKWILVFTLFLSLGRGEILALFLSLTICYFILIKKIDRNTFDKIFLSPYLKIFVLFFIFAYFYQFIFSNFYGITYRKQDKFIKPAFNEQRISFLIQSVKGFMNKPLFGWGLNSFQYISKDYTDIDSQWSSHPHNHLINILVESGICGLLLVLLLFITSVNRIIDFPIKNTESEKLFRVSILLGLFSVSIHSLLDFNFYYVSIQLYFWISLALFLPYSRQNRIKINIKIFFIFVFFLIFLFQSVILIKFGHLLYLSDLKTDKLMIDKNPHKFVRGLDLNYYYQKLAEDFIKVKNYPKTHNYLHQAMLFSDIDIEKLMKKDARVYLDEIEIYQRVSMDLSMNTIYTARYYYPYFFSGIYYDKYPISDSAKKDVSENTKLYISKVSDNIDKYMITKDDINITRVRLKYQNNLH
jgi:hypothetical protein